jgi:hypothetical protein
MAALAATACAGALALPATAAAAPPDGRVYEMVSPVEKGGYDITGWTLGGWANAAVDGERLNFGLYGNIEGGSASQLGTALMQATRTPAGWTSTGVLPRLQPGAPYRPDSGQGTISGESPDLRTLVVSSTQPATPGAIVGTWNLFSRAADGGFTLLAPGLFPWTAVGQVRVAGVSDDGRHVLFEADAQLTADAAAGVTNLYEAVDGVVRLAGILPDGSVPAGGTTGAGTQYHHTISVDGSRVFFLDATTGELYVRIDGQQTIRVSRPYDNGGGDAGVPGAASYAWATPDGSKVAFISAGRLTPDATTTKDAYLFDVATQRVTNLTATTGRNGDVSSIFGISDDGGTVYFSSLRLANLPALPTGVARAFYVWDHGTVRLVGGVRVGQREEASGSSALSSSFVAPGGRLLFTSSAPQPGNPMTGANVNASRNRVFLYDPAGAGSLSCLSCYADGTADPTADASPGTFMSGVGKLFVNRRAHAISDDGRRAWFDTPAALLPEDENGRRDVYQWEEGEGLSLISTGRSTADSFIGDASADGDDVFFFTREQLAAEDTDDLIDVYDARVGGGLPSRVPPERDRSCGADGCQGRAPGRPGTTTPGSEGDGSDGNVTDPIAPAKPIPFELTVAKLGRQAGPRLARTGALTLRVHVNRATKASAKLFTRSGGRWVLAGTSTRSLKSGNAAVRVTLSERARKRLARTRRLTVRVEVRAGGQVRRQQLTVTRPAHKQKGKANG